MSRLLDLAEVVREQLGEPRVNRRVELAVDALHERMAAVHMLDDGVHHRFAGSTIAEGALVELERREASWRRHRARRAARRAVCVGGPPPGPRPIWNLSTPGCDPSLFGECS